MSARLTRRSFLQRLGAIAAAGVVVRELPLPAPLPPPPLMFHKDAFALLQSKAPYVYTPVLRLDVLYGWPQDYRRLSCRVEGA